MTFNEKTEAQRFKNTFDNVKFVNRLIKIQE